MREAEKIEGSRFPVATLPSVLRRKAAELQQAGLVRVQFEGELTKSLPQFFQEPLRVCLALEPHEEVIAITNDDHLAGRILLTPRMGP